MIATNIEQSKKLAEILPIESADMVLLHEEPYETSFDGLHQLLVVPFTKYDKPWREKHKNISYFPAWSLSALINVLPQSIEDEVGTSYALNISKGFVEYYNPSLGALAATYHSVNAVTLVDACVEMIMFLKEWGHLIVLKNKT